MQKYFGEGEMLSMSTYPKMLYHYTSIESLALILKNRTIRLNSLTNMDDKQESQTQEGKVFGKSVFISSWTDDATESIPMWKMYTPSSAGVRIGLPPLPFVRHRTENRALLEAFAPPIPKREELCRTGDTFLDISSSAHLPSGVASTLFPCSINARAE